MITLDLQLNRISYLHSKLLESSNPAITAAPGELLELTRTVRFNWLQKKAFRHTDHLSKTWNGELRLLNGWCSWRGVFGSMQYANHATNFRAIRISMKDAVNEESTNKSPLRSCFIRAEQRKMPKWKVLSYADKWDFDFSAAWTSVSNCGSPLPFQIWGRPIWNFRVLSDSNLLRETLRYGYFSSLTRFGLCLQYWCRK